MKTKSKSKPNSSINRRATSNKCTRPTGTQSEPLAKSTECEFKSATGTALGSGGTPKAQHHAESTPIVTDLTQETEIPACESPLLGCLTGKFDALFVEVGESILNASVCCSTDNGVPECFDTDQHSVVQVKGPGDSLSDKQRNWNHDLQQAGFATHVCYVRPLEQKATTEHRC